MEEGKVGEPGEVEKPQNELQGIAEARKAEYEDSEEVISASMSMVDQLREELLQMDQRKKELEDEYKECMNKINACDIKPFDVENFPNPDYPFFE